MADEGRYLHFRCEWIVIPLEANTMWELFASLKFAPVSLFGGGPLFHSPEGYWVMPLVARVNSEADLAHFVSEIGEKIGLTKWIPVPEDWTKWQSIPGNALPDFIKGVQTMGRWNQKLRAQLESSG